MINFTVRTRKMLSKAYTLMETGQLDEIHIYNGYGKEDLSFIKKIGMNRLYIDDEDFEEALEVM